LEARVEVGAGREPNPLFKQKMHPTNIFLAKMEAQEFYKAVYAQTMEVFIINIQLSVVQG